MRTLLVIGALLLAPLAVASAQQGQRRPGAPVPRRALQQASAVRQTARKHDAGQGRRNVAQTRVSSSHGSRPGSPNPPAARP